jgi:small subunit ribosomal protein S5
MNSNVRSTGSKFVKRDFDSKRDFKSRGAPKKDTVKETICIRRVSKTVSRGRVRSISACVVVGDARGRVAVRNGSAKEAQDAIKKAIHGAEARMQFFPIWNKRTVPHDSQGEFGAVKVIVRRAPRGTGIIAGAVMRLIFQALGIKDVVAKVICGRNPLNISQALLNALGKLRSPSQITAQRTIGENSYTEKNMEKVVDHD